MASPHKYYLSVDDNIIDLNRFGFKGITDFLGLSLFTGMFKDSEELIEGLRRLGIHFHSDDVSMTIVKRTGTFKTNYDYRFVTDQIMYKSAADVMSIRGLESFLYDNRDNYDALSTFFEDYLVETSKLIGYFETKVKRLESILASDPQDRSSLEKELESKQNSLRNFLAYYSNITEILAIIGELRKRQYAFRRDVEIEYIERLKRFVDTEVHYIRGKRVSPNYRGLVKLASRVDSLLEDFPNLRKPTSSNAFISERSQLLKDYKAAVLKREKEITESNVEIGDDLSPDPDSFMFLEGTDFENLIGPGSTEEAICSVETDIANLEDRQKRQGK